MWFDAHAQIWYFSQNLGNITDISNHVLLQEQILSEPV